MTRPIRIGALAAAAALLMALLPGSVSAGTVLSESPPYNGIFGTVDAVSGMGEPYQPTFGSPFTTVMVITYDAGPTNAHLVMSLGGSSLLLGHANGELAPGVFEGASVGGYAPGQPRLDVDMAPAYACPGVRSGRFVILDGPTVTDGVVTTIAADFEIRCDGRSQLRGSVRKDSAIPFRWLTGVDQRWTEIPENGTFERTVTVANPELSAGITLGVPLIAEGDASFRVRSTTCPTGALAPMEPCAVTVVYDPAEQGTARAVLSIPTDLPLGAYRIDLDGTAGIPVYDINPGSTYVRPTTFYPYPDGYRDSTVVDGYNGTLATVKVEVRNSSGAIVRHITVGLRQHQWTTRWDGRNDAGTRVAGGTYTVVARYTDLAGNTASRSVKVVVSAKRLYTYSSTLTRFPDQFAAKGRGGTGKISTTSSYSRGRKLVSGTAGYAALGYSFTVPSATVYQKFTLKVTGRSPNGRHGIIGIQNFGISDSWQVEAFDRLVLAGPSYATWRTSTVDVRVHRSGRTVHGMVYVEPTSGARSQAFDIRKVQLTVTYALLK